MTSRLEGCAIDCAGPATLARFWAAAIGYQVLDEREDLVEIGPGAGSDEEYLAALGSVLPPRAWSLSGFRSRSPARTGSTWTSHRSTTTKPALRL